MARRAPFLSRAALALIAACSAAAAQQPAPSAAEPDPDAVTITALRNPVDKSYRKMVRGMDLFERQRHLAPQAPLRFKLLPRRRDTRMSDIDLELVGDSFALPIALAPDNTFTLERNRLALKENASVRPNRKQMTMTWRVDIRTPGLPPGTRRLGDLRLECAVGMEAGLVSNVRSVVGELAKFIFESADYCNSPNNRYLFFAERPIFNVTLVHGARREALPVDRLWGGASDDPDWKRDLPYCDCEVLIDRAYFLPLADPSWPHDTLVEFEFMDAPHAPAPSASR